MLHIFILFVVAVSFSMAQTLTFGVLENKGKAKVIKQYQPLVDFMSTELEIKIDLKVLNANDLEKQLHEKKIDIIATNPTHFIALLKNGDLTGAIGTEIKHYNEIVTQHLGGVIITRSDRGDIKTLLDLHNKTIAYPGKTFLAGYQAQAYELEKIGIHFPDENALLQVNGHEAVVKNVLAKKADVGFLRTGTIEEMILKNKLKRSDIFVVNEQKHSNFPWIVSTALYPEWPVSVRAGMDESLVKKIVIALYQYTPTDTYQGHLEGFSMPADYSSLDQLARTLHIRPYENVHDLSLKDIWVRHKISIYISSVSVLILIFLISWMYRKNLYEKKYAKSILDASPNPTVITNGKYIIDANKAMLSYLGYESLEAFKNDHNCICDYFEEGDTHEYLLPIIDDQTWVSYILSHPKDEHKAKITIYGQTTIFKIEVSDISDDKRFKAIAILTDITSMMKQSTIDPLTLLYNRFHFDLLFDHVLRITRRDNSPISIIFFDIDHFKKVNDTFGHLVGDDILRKIANLVRGMLRQSDVVARWGGEEFIILLPKTPLKAAEEVAEHLRETIEQQSFDNVGGVTCSFGVTDVCENESEGTILSRVDGLLYEAKEKGRNQVIVG